MPTSYGDEGKQIVYFVLLMMLDKEVYYSTPHLRRFSWDTIIQKVVLPEVIVRLIQEDLHITRDQATDVFKESGSFGKLMHPGDDDSHLDAIQEKVAKMFQRARAELAERENSSSSLNDDMVLKTEAQDLEEIGLAELNTIIEDGHVVYILDD